MEVGLDGAIDYKKGCYLGQEPIVRIRDRGHINWRLVGLDIAGADDPAPGDPLESDAKPKAGKVTSAGAPPRRSRRRARDAAHERPRRRDGARPPRRRRLDAQVRAEARAEATVEALTDC